MEVAAAAIGLLEATFRIINRLKKAYGRMKDAPQILEKYSNELKTIKTIIEVVDDEQSLQTANVHSEVEKVKKIEGRLKDCLKTAEKNSKESVKPMAQFSHQLFKGSNDEKKISEIMMELGSVKATLCLHIQLSSVGVMRDMENKLVAKLDVIEHVNQTLVELLGQTGGLRIKGLLENRTARDDGTIVLSAEDIAYLNGRTAGTTQNDGPVTERIIIGNMTQDQAVMINGPIERDLWKNLSRLEIRDNRATGRSIMINYITTFEALDYMRGWQRELIEMEDKARSRMLHRVNSGDSGVGLSDDD